MSVSVKKTNTKQAPLYQRVHTKLVEDIKSGRLTPHAALPSERVLAEQSHISRMTARKALEELESDGFAYCQGRKGRFVSELRMQHDIGNTLSFTTKALQDSLDLKIEVLKQETIMASAKLASILKISKGEPVHRYQRLFRISEEAILIETESISALRFEGFFDQNLEQSTTALFEKEYGIQNSQAELTVRCISIPPEVLGYFGRNVPPYGMEVELVIRDLLGVPYCFGQQIWCSERAEFSVLTNPS